MQAFASPPATAPPRVPSGVSDFDAITGGWPVGSVILLRSEAGAGHGEFALSSAARLMRATGTGRPAPFEMGPSRAPLVIPRQVTYLSFTRSREELLWEVESTFPREYHEVLSRHLDFVDLAASYFSDSLVPSDWTETRRSLLVEGTSERPTEILAALADALEPRAQDSLVILDSLSDLLVRESVRPEQLITLVKGLRRRAKAWKGVMYLLLARGVAEPRLEQAILDSVDGVLGFSWVQSASKSARSRALVIEKFMPLLSHVPTQLQGRFVLRVNPLDGLVTTQYERI